MTLPLFDANLPQVDANGRPLNGALLYFYTAGTTTPITVYQDSAAGTPHANPVVADVTGMFAPIYVADLLIKVVLKSAAGVTIVTIDNIQPSSWDALGTQGADVASASTVNLDMVGGARADLTGTTGVTAITLAAGKTKIVKTAGRVLLTASSTLVVNGQNSSYSYTSAAGEFFLVTGESGLVRISSISRPAMTPPMVAATMNTAVTAGNDITTWTEITDRNSDFDNATGIFVASIKADYHVTATILSNTAGQNTLGLMIDTGSGFGTFRQARVQAANISLVVAVTVTLGVGDRLKLNMVDGSVTTSGTQNNHLEIRALFP